MISPIQYFEDNFIDMKTIDGESKPVLKDTCFPVEGRIFESQSRLIRTQFTNALLQHYTQTPDNEKSTFLIGALEWTEKVIRIDSEHNSESLLLEFYCCFLCTDLPLSAVETIIQHADTNKVITHMGKSTTTSHFYPDTSNTLVSASRLGKWLITCPSGVFEAILKKCNEEAIDALFRAAKETIISNEFSRVELSNESIQGRLVSIMQAMGKPHYTPSHLDAAKSLSMLQRYTSKNWTQNRGSHFVTALAGGKEGLVTYLNKTSSKREMAGIIHLVCKAHNLSPVNVLQSPNLTPKKRHVLMKTFLGCF